MSLAPGRRIGPYEILASLGAGGMGQVYRARDTRLGRTVALKVLPPEFAADPDARARFDREARAVAALNHPHICTLHDLGRENGVDFLVMELVDGETLAARLERGPVALDQAVAVAQQIAEALDKAHRLGIVHRDLKPSNIMLVRGGGSAAPIVKLLDFGLAKVGRSTVRGFSGPDVDVTHGSATIAPLTGAGTIMGTLNYMSPEQVEGKDADHRADIFALGCVIYEMVTGARAFAGETPASTMAAILERQPPSAATKMAVTPVWLEWVIRTALAKDPDDRWQSAADLARALQELPRVASVSNHPAPVRWRFIGLGGATLAAVVFAGAALFLWTTRGVAVPPAHLARLAVATNPATLLAANIPGGAVAIAPTGDVVAFVGARDGVRSLYVRRLDQPEARALPNSAAASGPFFSPDGQWLAYTHDLGSSGSRILKVSMSSGTPTTICTMPEAPRGAVWTRGGDIILGMAHGPLHRVPAEGGELTPLWPLSAGEEAHRWPAILPDDEHVIFTAGAPNLSRWDGAPLVVQNVRTRVRHALNLQGTAPRFVRRDRLVFNRVAQLFSVAFDPATLKVTGAPTMVLDNVTNVWNSGAAQYDISAAGDLLFPGVADASGVGMTRLVRGAGEASLSVAARGYTAPVVASNGRFAAVEIVDEADDIWVINLQTGTPQRLTFNDDEDETPVWSPDDLWVAYASAREGGRQILRRRADGGGPEEVLWKGSEHIHVHDWTPDGRYLVTSAVTEAVGSGLSLLDLHATPPAIRPFLPGRRAVRSAHVTRDGRWIAYASGESGRDEVYVQDFPQLTARWQVSHTGGLNPMWTADGRALYYRRGATLYRVRVERTDSAVSFGTATEVFTSLAAVKGDHRAYAVLPDGDPLVLKATASDRGSYLNLFQNWTETIARAAAR